MIWLLAHPHYPLSRQQIVSLFLSLPVYRRSSLGGRGALGEERGAESYDRENTWASINRSILSGSVYAP
jgi:hypothetical protein